MSQTDRKLSLSNKSDSPPNNQAEKGKISGKLVEWEGNLVHRGDQCSKTHLPRIFSLEFSDFPKKLYIFADDYQIEL